MTKEEIRRVAEFLKITPEEVVEKYTRKFGGQFSFKENVLGSQRHDCIFLAHDKVSETRPDGTSVVVTRGRCSIYSVRPLQCRTWPFWPENLEDKQSWNKAARKCHGMNAGRRSFTLKQIEALRDAKDWPKNPPSANR